MEVAYNIPNKGTRAFVESVISFFVQDLKLQKSKFHLEVFTKRGMADEDGCRGMVTKLGPNLLVMFLDSKLDVERLILTIAHEMVHVKQHARGQLKDIAGRTQVRYWMGKKVNKTYFNQPWEIEAFSKERILANKVFQIINKR
jgi:Zn-dependent peptidase ImmA (M78 family)